MGENKEENLFDKEVAKEKVADNEEVKSEKTSTDKTAENLAVKTPDTESPEEIEEESKEEVVQSTIEDFDETPQSDKYSKITPDTVIPEDLILTIEDVVPQRVYLKKADGTVNEPCKSANGEYYKAKLIIKIKEEIDGNKIREMFPGIFYGFNDGVLASPRLAKACEDEDMDDRFTSEVAKIRNLYCKFVKKDPKDVSDKEFAKGLINMKFKPKKVTGKFEGRTWAKLSIEKFVE